ncbi:hypothetical protein TNCV_980211 [Trichonephila clavipes]|uniref:Uncharacterized protein n=1 Tax=Trichonephila clavipes TaxID=2585209 RepID=A0A8X6RZH8_TRICX|nr:hypothetical protein TNCV_980211 [Trichonephila clavipes]
MIKDILPDRKDVPFFRQRMPFCRFYPDPLFRAKLCPGILPRIQQMRNVGSGQGCLAFCHFAGIINDMCSRNHCFGSAFYYWLIASSNICDWLSKNGRKRPIY